MKRSGQVSNPIPDFPVIKSVSYVLAHTPDLVCYGSKPEREIAKEGSGCADSIRSMLRDYATARDYPPHQVFIGNLEPEALWGLDAPWWGKKASHSRERHGKYGEILPQDEFLGFMQICDEFDLLDLEDSFLETVRQKLSNHPLISDGDRAGLSRGRSLERIEAAISKENAFPISCGGRVVGCMKRGHDEDPYLSPSILLENLSCKATGVLAMRWLFRLTDSGVEPADVSYVINTGEEAVGDRYQRGGGNLGKAMAKQAACLNSSGGDVKAFCCGPVHGIVMGASLVRSEVFENVLVVGGASLAKLGMKFQGHLAKQMPILEDVLASFAILIGPPDGRNPQIRLDAIGKHDVHCGALPQRITEALVAMPLEKLGKKILDIDRFAVELHNPEITVPAGSANVPQNNYRVIAGLAALRGEMERSGINDFERSHGLPGFSPTQGHVASAIPFLGHARDRMLAGELRNSMFIAKGSLFLGKMTDMSDGMSFVLEAS